MENRNFWSETQERGRSAEDAPNSQPSDPDQIGRYRVVRRLGQGGFGRVYLAHDADLDRSVAIKVPNPERVAQRGDSEVYLAEARSLAKLDHPSIVPVYDLGRTEDGLCYVVSKYIAGRDLSERLRQSQPSLRESAELVAVIAGALHHAHTRGLVHRDIKPANILIDGSNEPWVADFGLALKDEDYGKGARHAGTPSYMSPEQARGEGHRVDGRSDIFSLGVVFYELLTGRRPFRGDSRAEVMDQIVYSEPRPLRQIDDSIPRELERICQKALAKRASERYDTGRDMAEDLRHFLQIEASVGPKREAPTTIIPTPAPSTQEETSPPVTSIRSDSDGRLIRIVPKGLRSFDQHDSDFFLELLPGPRDREGLPDSLRFWRIRIESTEPDTTFKVGLIYGPSGCGKSSMVKAGLLPRLGKHVLPVYVEATPEETETRLLKGLRKVCPDLPSGGTTVDALAALRRGRLVRPGQKVLIVLDQFEQWLFARRDEQNTELVAALRQCDGAHVQAVVMVRDDFWMAATRFMRDLEIRLVEGENSAAVDLFDLLHARRVLAAFGRAYGVLPDNTSDLSPDQRSFLEQSVAGLAQDGKVISVRLALFAEMVKGKPWSPATWRDVGGTQGVGITFLEETFSLSTAPPEHRLHQKAAQGVLRALLPQSGTDIKGQMRSESELREASGYASRPRDFDDLIGILDPDLRLITPTDPEGSSDEGQPARQAQRYYQLTHDYLVHSLRDWLTRKQRESRRGRAELRLAERAAIWESKPENRHLPSLLEWASIEFLSSPKCWTDPQRRMMHRAGRVHGIRTLGLVALLALLSWCGIEIYGNHRASVHVESLRTANLSEVPAIVGRLSRYRRWADSRLKELILSNDNSGREKLNASLALLPVDRSQLPFLQEKLLEASAPELPVLRTALDPYRSELIPGLWNTLESAKQGDTHALPAASALASYDPGNPKWEVEGNKVAHALVSVNSLLLRAWIDALRSVHGKLVVPLTMIFQDKSRSETVHSLVTDILTDYASDDPVRLAELLMIADPKAYGAFFPVAERQVDKVLPLLKEELKKNAPPAGKDASGVGQAKDSLAERQARAAVALIRLGQAAEVWPRLRHTSEPRLRSFIVNWLRPLGAESNVLTAELEHRAQRSFEGETSQVLLDSETSIRRALILALGTFNAEELSPGEREQLKAKFHDLFYNDPDAGVHGAAEWTLRRWKQDEKPNAIGAESQEPKGPGRRRWYINRQGQTFAVIDGPVHFHMGSPQTDRERAPESEPEYEVTIPRRFAIASTEVTVAQFQQFIKTHARFKPDESTERALKQYSPDPDGPWIGASWYTAAAYCNWLSETEGLPEDQWCYQPNKGGLYAEGMTIPANFLQRNGYRLPTEAEWEYACRAGTVTSRYYGDSGELLGKYAWYLANARERAWQAGSLLPNDLGLFDTLGNVYEWCHDGKGTNRPEKGGIYSDVIQSDEIILEKRIRICRGGMYAQVSRDVRAAHRTGDAPNYEGTSNGFRLARTCK